MCWSTLTPNSSSRLCLQIYSGDQHQSQSLKCLRSFKSSTKIIIQRAENSHFLLIFTLIAIADYKHWIKAYQMSLLFYSRCLLAVGNLTDFLSTLSVCMLCTMFTFYVLWWTWIRPSCHRADHLDNINLTLQQEKIIPDAIEASRVSKKSTKRDTSKCGGSGRKKIKTKWKMKRGNDVECTRNGCVRHPLHYTIY